MHFTTEEEYHKFFDSDEVNRLFNELIVDRLATKEIMLLLEEKPWSVGQISEILNMSQSDVSRHLSRSTKEGLVKFDDSQKVFAHV